jgi:hypothetical protein
MPLVETYEVRHTFVRSQSQRQTERWGRVTAEREQRATGVAPQAEPVGMNDVRILPVVDAGIHGDAGIMKAAKPRKRISEGEHVTGEEPSLTSQRAFSMFIPVTGSRSSSSTAYDSRGSVRDLAAQLMEPLLLLQIPSRLRRKQVANMSNPARGE